MLNPSFVQKETIETLLILNPMELDRLDPTCVSRLKTKIETYDTKYGYIHEIVKVVSKDCVQIQPNGNVIYNVTFEALCIRLKKNDILDAVVTQTQSDCVFVSTFPHQNIKTVVPAYLCKNIETINKDDKIKVEIVDILFSDNIKCIAKQI